MNNPLRHPADPQTASIPAEGELRSKALFRLEQVIPNPARPRPQIIAALTWQRVWCLLEHAHRTIQEPKTIQYP